MSEKTKHDPSNGQAMAAFYKQGQAANKQPLGGNAGVSSPAPNGATWPGRVIG